MFQTRTIELQERLKERGLSLALITDVDSVYYYSGFYDYLHMDFGRPTVLVIPAEGECSLITPMMEFEMAGNMTWIEKIHPWLDGQGEEWRGPLKTAIDSVDWSPIGIEPDSMPSLVRNFVDQCAEPVRLKNAALVIAGMRMIKGPEEIQLARDAGKVAEAMMTAGRDTIGEGVPEYEVALAISAAGTRKAAELLKNYNDALMSPNTHFLQIMASGSDITMPHRRPTPKIIVHGEPVFLCFCGMTNFHRFKLGFDRTFWVNEITDQKQADIYRVAVDSQAAALKTIGPGVVAEDVHAAYAEVIQDAGYDYPFRCGRATGFSFLESPQLVFGDKTVLQPGMVLAVDGSVSVSGFFRAQVGDSIVLTEDGYELLTIFGKSLDDVILN